MRNFDHLDRCSIYTVKERILRSRICGMQNNGNDRMGAFLHPVAAVSSIPVWIDQHRWEALCYLLWLQNLFLFARGKIWLQNIFSISCEYFWILIPLITIKQLRMKSLQTGIINKCTWNVCINSIVITEVCWLK